MKKYKIYECVINNEYQSYIGIHVEDAPVVEVILATDIAELAREGRDIIHLLWDHLMQGTVPVLDKENIDNYMRKLEALAGEGG